MPLRQLLILLVEVNALGLRLNEIQLCRLEARLLLFFFLEDLVAKEPYGAQQLEELFERDVACVEAILGSGRSVFESLSVYVCVCVRGGG